MAHIDYLLPEMFNQEPASVAQLWHQPEAGTGLVVVSGGMDAPEPMAKPQNDGADVTAALLELASFTTHLQLQSHLLHLNYRGANFLSVHEFLKEQYQRHQAEFDVIGELIRAAGSAMPNTAQALLTLSPTFIHADSNDPAAICGSYIENLSNQAALAADIHNHPGCRCAIEIPNAMAGIADSAKKAAWLLDSCF